MASAAMMGVVQTKVKWTNTNTPDTISQIASKSRPKFFVPIQFIFIDSTPFVEALVEGRMRMAHVVV
jgi:hypothetical protein